MTHTTTYNHTTRHSARHHVALLTTYILFLLGIPATATAQIRIGGNVYGGGNQGDLGGSTKVVLKGGAIEGSVYGGARMADVGGHTYVNLDGAGQTGKLVVNAVYGGNAIAGTIGTVGGDGSALPFNPAAPNLDKASLSAAVHATQNTQYPMIVGSLYGGGNGAYDYDYDDEDSIVLDNLGQTYYRLLNDKEKAKEYFEKAIEIKPGQIDTLYFLAQYDLEAGDKEAAKEKLEKAMEGRFSPLNHATKEMVQELLNKLNA